MNPPVPFTSAWHVVAIFIVFVAGFFAARCVGVKIGSVGWRPIALYFYHTIWCIVFFWYSNINGADSFAYYYSALEGHAEFQLGTDFVILLVELLQRVFGLSYLGVFLVFNIFGAIGYILFDASLENVNVGSPRWIKLLALLIILLPSVSFWSSAISKDAISFMAIGLALWSACKLQSRMKLMLLSILLMLLVRPHMAGLMVISLAMSMFFDGSLTPPKRLALSVVFIVSAAVLVPFALDYAGVRGGASIEAVSNFIEKRESYARGETSIDLSAMSFPEKLFTYTFRPMLFEARTLFELAASFDNVILIFLFVYGFFLMIKISLDYDYGNKFFMFAYVLLAWSVLSLTTVNLGIALRQKWMFVPFLIYLSFAYINKQYKSFRNSPL